MNRIMTKLYFSVLNTWNDFVHDEKGDVNIVSIVVLIGIAVILAVAFRKAIANLLGKMFDSIETNAGGAVGGGEEF